jgi:predicted nucleotidyltransferase
MSKAKQIEERISQVVSIIGELANDFVLVGGSAMPLLITNSAAPDARVTVDVDVLVEVASRSEYQVISERLSKVGFNLDMMEGVICRFKNGELVLDVMPTNPEILGFGSQWYEHVFAHSFEHSLASGKIIKVIAPPLFLCTKYFAYENRGSNDSKDLEDIVALVDGRVELLSELQAASPAVKAFIVAKTLELLQSDVAEDLEQYMPFGSNDKGRVHLIKQRFIEISQISL